MPKTKAHTQYKLKDGTRVRGVTTIIDANAGWNKQVLIAWTRREALAGNDPQKVKEKAADIGTLVHYMIECDLKEEKPDLSEYSPDSVEKAENAFMGWLDWTKDKKIEVIATELPLVSELHKYGGTIDNVLRVDGVDTLIDIKSSNGLYLEHLIQLAAYQRLYFEAHVVKLKPEIIQLGKEDGSFHHHAFRKNELEDHYRAFTCLLELDRIHKKVKI